jgi:hypothetical protein
MAAEPSSAGPRADSPDGFPDGLPDGLIAIVKSDCPACSLAQPVLVDLAERAGLTVYTQDDPTFPADADWVVDDTDLTTSWHLDLDAVPTLLRIEGGVETARTIGWDRDRWEQLTGVTGLGPDLPPFKPG